MNNIAPILGAALMIAVTLPIQAVQVKLVPVNKEVADFAIQYAKLRSQSGGCDTVMRHQSYTELRSLERGASESLDDGDYCLRRAKLRFIYHGPVVTKVPSPEFDAYLKVRNVYERARTWTPWRRFTVKGHNIIVVVD